MFPFVVVGAAVVIALVLATGAWRYAMRPFGIDPREMTVGRLGFDATNPADVAMIHGVCRAFSGGFNAMISRASSRAWLRFTQSQPVFFRPFAAEGAAMGFPLRTLGTCSPRRFERGLIAVNDGYRYLQYVGLGFWYAMRDRDAADLARFVDGLDPLHGMLCWDGYGFKFGFFDYADRARWADRFARVPGYARNVVHQGMGRSLWFRFMGRPDALVRNAGTFGDFATDVAAGVGLAVAFTTIDRPDRGLALLERMPAEWYGDVLLGMCFAYKARSITEPSYFEACLDGMGRERRQAVRTAVARCDAIEREVRAADPDDGYRCWREGVRDWLCENVVYPFGGLKVSERVASGAELAPV